LHDLIRVGMAVIALRDPDTDGNDDRLPALPSFVGFRLLEARPEPPPHREPAGFDCFAQLLEMRQALVLAFAREDERELLTAVAVRRAAARGLREPRGDEAQHVIARIVAVGVVEAL